MKLLRKEPGESMAAKVSQAIALTSLILPSVVAQEEDNPFTDFTPPEDKPPRVIKKLPDSIRHDELPNGKHIYTVTRIYNASEKSKAAIAKANRERENTGRDINNPFGDRDYLDDFPESGYKSSMPDCEKVTINFEYRTCTFITTREIALPELADAIDHMAWNYGDLPYWNELEARDIAKSEHYHEQNFSVEPFEGEMPDKLAWFHAHGQQSVSSLIGLFGFRQGKLTISPTTAHCMAHSCFAIRVFDWDGKVYWRDDSTALADIQFAVADVDLDGDHDILIKRYDHGESDRFLIRQNMETNSPGKIGSENRTRTE